MAGAEEEGSRPRHPRLQVSQGDERLLLPAGPGRGHGLPAPAGGVEAQVIAAAAAADNDPAAGVAISAAAGRSAAGRLVNRWTDRIGVQSCEHTPPPPNSAPPPPSL